MVKIINVAVGILYQDNCVLLASRPINKPQANFWEFPGGKIESGEDAIVAVIRELKEELGITVMADNCVNFASIKQTYEFAIIKLSLIMIQSYVGVPHGVELQKLYWQDLNAECKLSPLLATTPQILKIIQEFLK